MPDAGASVVFVGAFAQSYGAVSITESCALTVVTAAPGTSAPTAADGGGDATAPSRAPTAAADGGCASDRSGYEFALALDGRLKMYWALVDGGAAVKVALAYEGGDDDVGRRRTRNLKRP